MNNHHKETLKTQIQENEHLGKHYMKQMIDPNSNSNKSPVQSYAVEKQGMFSPLSNECGVLSVRVSSQSDLQVLKEVL